jgi:hypothetical protein
LQLSFAGSKQKTSEEKIGNPKCKGSKQKTSDEKRGNPKIQGAQNKGPLIKKKVTPKRKELKTKDIR